MVWRGKAGGFSETYRSNMGVSFEWKIPDILSLPATVGDFYCSPSIKLSDTIWYLCVYPKGKPGTSKWITLALVRCSLGKPVRFSLSIKKVDGTEEEIARQRIFPEHHFSFVSTKFLHLPELAPSDSLTVRCSLWSSAPLFVKDGLHDPSAIQSELWSEANARDEERADLEIRSFSTLRKQLKDLLVAGDDHDVAIKVGHREFGAHRCILRARSTVFDAMFKHKMKESEDGSISVEDCDPDAFGEFLRYVYTGEVADLSPSSAMGLYYAADKYDVSGLKEVCVHSLKGSLSPAVICDVLSLATKHAEWELMEHATSFFVGNTKAILETSEWRRFVKDNPDEANELYVKSFEMLHEKKTKSWK